MSEPQAAREALEREIYWLGTTEPDAPLTAIGELVASLERLERQLHADVNRAVPTALIRMPRSRWKRAVKRFTHRAMRPVTRRYDRVNAELAAAVLDLAEHVSRLEGQVRRLQRQEPGAAGSRRAG